MKILLDMDGVLVDYYAGVCQAFNRPAEPYASPKGDWNFFKAWGITSSDVAKHMNAEFYANLGWMSDGWEILSYAYSLVGEENVFLLTSPWDTPGCHEGKVTWVRRHVPTLLRRLMIGSSKELCARADHLLVDDADKNVSAFKAAGGRAFLYARNWNSKHHLVGAALQDYRQHLQGGIQGDIR